MVRRKKLVCNLGLLHHPMTLAGLRKTESGTRLLRKLQLPAVWGTLDGRTPGKASAYDVPGKPGAVHSIYPGSFPSWTSTLCSLPVQSFPLSYICYLGALPLKKTTLVHPGGSFKAVLGGVTA